MRKNFLTQEYTREFVAGTFNMKEGRFWFGSKILEIEDVIDVNENSLIWKESEQNIQGLGLESVNSTVNTYDLKKANHKLSIFQPQTDKDINEFTKWQLDVNVRNIVRTYIFGLLKKNRTFAGISNDKTRYNSVDKSIYEYIDFNIFPRIKFFSVNLYTKYYNIGQLQENVDNTGNGFTSKKYDTIFRDDFVVLPQSSDENQTNYQKRSIAYKETIRVKNYQLLTDANQENVSLIFKQTQSSIDYKFDYYFDVVYVKV